MGNCHNRYIIPQRFIRANDIHNFKLYLENNHSKNLILSCIDNHKLEFLKAFLSHPNSDPNVGLSRACQKRQSKVIDVLLKDRRTKITFEVLTYIILHNKIKLLKILMRNPLFDPTMNNNFAVKTAIKLDFYEIFCLLTRHKLFSSGDNIDMTLTAAGVYNRSKMVNFLIYSFGRV